MKNYLKRAWAYIWRNTLGSFVENVINVLKSIADECHKTTCPEFSF